MTTNAEIVNRLERVADDAEYATKAYKEVLATEGEKDITLVDGSTTPNLNKRLVGLVSSVQSVNGKKGKVVLDPEDLGLPNIDRMKEIFTLNETKSKSIAFGHSDYSSIELQLTCDDKKIPPFKPQNKIKITHTNIKQGGIDVDKNKIALNTDLDFMRIQLRSDTDEYPSSSQTKIAQVVFKFLDITSIGNSLVPYPRVNVKWNDQSRPGASERIRLPLASAATKQIGGLIDVGMFETTNTFISGSPIFKYTGKTVRSIHLSGAIDFLLQSVPEFVSKPELFYITLQIRQLSSGYQSAQGITQQYLSVLPLIFSDTGGRKIDPRFFFKTTSNEGMVNNSSNQDWIKINMPVNKDIIFIPNSTYTFEIRFDVVDDKIKIPVLGGVNTIMLSGGISGLVDATIEIEETTKDYYEG